MKLSELISKIEHDSERDPHSSDFRVQQWINSIENFMSNFGEGAAVFIAGRLVWFGDAGAARNEARMIAGAGHAKKETISIKRIVV